jgi:hypothetical protein
MNLLLEDEAIGGGNAYKSLFGGLQTTRKVACPNLVVLPDLQGTIIYLVAKIIG